MDSSFPSKLLNVNVMNRIIIADDSVENAHVMELILASEGYQTKVLTNGEKLIEEVETYRPAVVILDVHLGKFDGRELAKQIRNSEDLKQIKLVLVSAGVTPKVAEEISSDYCDAFIMKPFDLEDLLDTVSRLSSQ